MSIRIMKFDTYNEGVKHMDNEKIVSAIKDLCKNHNITITKLEEELGFSQGLISRWSKSAPSLERIIDIADHFNISIDEVIGRDIFNNDLFLKTLCDRTVSKDIEWYKFEKIMDANLKQYTRPADDFLNTNLQDVFLRSEYEVSYFINHNGGYISIYGRYFSNNITKPITLALFIQPKNSTRLIEQKYQTEQLKPLWLKVLSQLGDEAPDEIRAEELKNSFLNSSLEKENQRKLSIEYTPYKYLDENQRLDELLRYTKSPEFQQLMKLLSDDNFTSKLQAINSKLQEKINDISSDSE